MRSRRVRDRTRSFRTGFVLQVARLACAGSLAGCAAEPRTTPANGAGSSTAASAGASADAAPGIDSLNARVERAYRDKDPAAYARLYTDSAVFEWPAVATVRGRAALEGMARGGWAPLPDMTLKIIPASRRLAADHATELGAFEQSWRDSTGGRSTEYGRYVTVLARQADGQWLMDRFFGFSDSTRTAPPAR